MALVADNRVYGQAFPIHVLVLFGAFFSMAVISEVVNRKNVLFYTVAMDIV